MDDAVHPFFEFGRQFLAVLGHAADPAQQLDSFDGLFDIPRIYNKRGNAGLVQQLDDAFPVAVNRADGQVGRKAYDFLNIEFYVAAHVGLAPGVFRVIAVLGHTHHAVAQAEVIENFGQTRGHGNDSLRPGLDDHFSSQ